MCPHNHSECCSCPNKEQEHDHDHGTGGDVNIFKLFLPAIISFILLITAIVLNYSGVSFFRIKGIALGWYIVAYLPVGYPVFKEMCEEFKNKDFFNEFSLMFLASVGAFYIGQYPEAVAVMLFYSIGENFQGLAVSRAKKNINSLLDQRPDEATVLEKDNSLRIMKAKEIKVGSVLQLKPGEKVALDGKLISPSASFNTSALTGESAPQTKEKGEVVLAGMINLNTVSQMKVTTPYSDSK